MPYVRCANCGVRSYQSTPWSSAANCSNCGSVLDVPRRHGFNNSDARDEQPAGLLSDPDRSSLDEPERRAS
jgi:ribosomal protein L37E